MWVHTWQGSLLPPSPLPVSGISPYVILPQLPTPHCPSSSPPLTDLSVWSSPPCIHVYSLFNTAYEWKRVVLDFLFLCQFAENDGFQVHPCPYKGHELIIFDGYIAFYGVYVPHFPCPVYHQWAFGLVPGLCSCKECCNEHCIFFLTDYIQSHFL